jgi:hypothetical protein
VGDTKDHIFRRTRLLESSIHGKVKTNIGDAPDLGFRDERSTHRGQDD